MNSIRGGKLVLLGLMVLFSCSPESIHERVLALDTHVDTPLMLSRPDWNIGEAHSSEISKVDFPRLKKGGLDAVFFAVFVAQGPRTPEGNLKAKQQALLLFNHIHQAVEGHPEQAELAFTPADAYAIEKKGKRAVYIGMENGYPLGNDISLIKKFYDLGARYITLCHTKNNDICDSSTDAPEHQGLSDFGRKVVQEMNRLGIMIDVSHISDESFYQVIAVTKAPIIASHSCARALCSSPRNLDDNMLKKLTENNGVIQVCMVPSYVKEIKPDPEREKALHSLRNKYNKFSDLTEQQWNRVRAERRALDKKYPPTLPTVSDFVDHIDYIVRVAGIDQVGIGSDFDGGGQLQDCQDGSDYGKITQELLARGYTESEIEKIWGGNLIRVFREVAAVAENMRN